MITEFIQIVSRFPSCLTIFFFSVSSRIHESIPPLLSEDELSYYLCDAHVNTPFEFSLMQIDEVESTLLS